MSKLTDQQIQTASLMKLQQALVAIERAQHLIGDAREALSALEGATAEWTRSGKMYDDVRAFWYRVNALRHSKKLRLDSDHIARLEKSPIAMRVLRGENSAATTREGKTAADQGDVT